VVAGEKPFFISYATGATHTPHQVPQKWIDKYKGKFDRGWDVIRQEAFDQQKKLRVIPANAGLTSRPAGLPAWDSLTPQQKKLLAHQAEVYAGYAEQTDYEIGRLLDAIREEGQADNTVVLEIFGDNGASAEGGLEGSDVHDVNGKPLAVEPRLDTADLLGSETYMNHYAAAWAWALSSPFQGTISLFVKDRRVVYEINAYGNRSGKLIASDQLKPGTAHIVLSLTPNRGGQKEAAPFGARQPVSAVGQLTIDGQAQGEAPFANVNLAFAETLDVGGDLGTPVSPDYKSPDRFTGKIDKVTIEIK
jgi:hypothetical protein